MAKKRGKKRPFAGNRYVDAEGVSIAKRTAKFCTPPSSQLTVSSADDNIVQDPTFSRGKTKWIEPVGNAILDLNLLVSSLEGIIKFPNDICGQNLILQESERKRGWAIKFRWQCTACNHSIEFSNSKTTNRSPDINLKLAYASRATGQNQFQLINFCSILDLPLPIERKVLPSVRKIAENSMVACCDAKKESPDLI